jgi:hypothetical protein
VTGLAAATTSAPGVLRSSCRVAWALAKAWYARDHRIFGDATRHRIDELLKTPRTVRVWYNTNSECECSAPRSHRVWSKTSPCQPTDKPYSQQQFASFRTVIRLPLGATVRSNRRGGRWPSTAVILR